MIQIGKIVILREIRGDFPIGHHLVAAPGVYRPFVNPHGAVSVEVDGQLLGLKPGEFQWLDKPPTEAYQVQ